jgi:hypothetical protein
MEEGRNMRRVLQLLGIGRRAHGGDIDYVSGGVVQLGECGTCGKRMADADLYEHMRTHLTPPDVTRSAG